MKFYDKVSITIQSGKGGDGAVAGRRELYVPRGGPEGGDGGRGGKVIFIGSENENTLIKFRYQHFFIAENGEPGRTKQQYGKHGEDLVIPVPLGTIIRDLDHQIILYQILSDGEHYVVADGGHGGKGNMHFKTPILQYPTFALKGEPSHTKKIELELQLLSDVALIGTPNVGKSTLINTMADVKAKVADYPFTTLIPHLGSVKDDDFSFNVIDIPGLIEGASTGKGLGNQFLRHIIKTKIFAFVLDMQLFESGIKDFFTVMEEILSYMKKIFVGSEERGFPISKITYERELLSATDLGDPNKNGSKHGHHGGNDSKNLILRIFGRTPTDKVLLMEKAFFLVINKYDMINDEEILGEYEGYLLEHCAEYRKKHFNFNIDQKMLMDHTIVVSGVTHYHINILIKKFSQTLQGFSLHHIPLHYEKVESTPLIKEPLIDVTNESLPFLLTENYLDEQEAKYIKIWLYNNEDITRLVYMMPRENEQAEQRFREKLEKIGILNDRQKHGVRKGDIIQFHSLYDGVSDKFITYDYVAV